MARQSYAIRPLTVQEVAAMDGFTHIATVTAGDLTQATANTAQTLDHGPIPLGSNAQVEVRLKTPFENPSDAAFNSTTVSAGDEDSTTSLLAAQQVNKNGAFITVARGALSAVYAADKTFRTTWSSMAAKNLNALTKGQLDIVFKNVNPIPITNVKGDSSVTK